MSPYGTCNPNEDMKVKFPVLIVKPEMEDHLGDEVVGGWII